MSAEKVGFDFFDLGVFADFVGFCFTRLEYDLSHAHEARLVHVAKMPLWGCGNALLLPS